jgi:hypothetical protein
MVVTQSLRALSVSKHHTPTSPSLPLLGPAIAQTSSTGHPSPYARLPADHVGVGSTVVGAKPARLWDYRLWMYHRWYHVSHACKVGPCKGFHHKEPHLRVTFIWHHRFNYVWIQTWKSCLEPLSDAREVQWPPLAICQDLSIVCTIRVLLSKTSSFKVLDTYQ